MSQYHLVQFQSFLPKPAAKSSKVKETKWLTPSTGYTQTEILRRPYRLHVQVRIRFHCIPIYIWQCNSFSSYFKWARPSLLLRFGGQVKTTYPQVPFLKTYCSQSIKKILSHFIQRVSKTVGNENYLGSSINL